MGIMQNKVTRRVALGSIAAGLGGTALVIRSLRAPYETNFPSVSQSFAASHVKSASTVTVNGYTLKVPAVEMDIKKPGDWEKFQELIKEATKKALDNDPGYQAHLKQQLAARKEKMEREGKETKVKQPQEQMEADVQKFNAKIDNDGSIDAANKELIKKEFRESLKKSYEMAAGKIKS